jgi:hypothetical protein
MENQNLREQVVYLGWVLGGCKRLLEDVSAQHEVYRGREADEIISEMVDQKDLKPDDHCLNECVACRASRLLTWINGRPIPPPKWREHGMVADNWIPEFMEEPK